MNMLSLPKRLMGKRDHAALAKESCVSMVLDRVLARARFKIREEVFIAVDLSQRW